MRYVAQFMRIFPLAAIAAACLFLIMHEARIGASIAAAPLPALQSR
jgi:hypothetical protein